MKKITAMSIDQLSFVYVYYYVFPRFEPDRQVKVLPSEGYDDVSMKEENSVEGSMITGHWRPFAFPLGCSNDACLLHYNYW